MLMVSFLPISQTYGQKFNIQDLGFVLQFHLKHVQFHFSYKHFLNNMPQTPHHR